MHKSALTWQRDSETFVRLAKGNFTKAEDGISGDGIHTIFHMVSYTHNYSQSTFLLLRPAAYVYFLFVQPLIVA